MPPAASRPTSTWSPTASRPCPTCAHRGGFVDAARPDLILLDLNLPRKSGHEVLAEVKQDPELRRIPVVVLTTSLAQEDVSKELRPARRRVHVSKPVDFDQFAEVVRQIDEFFGNVAELPDYPRPRPPPPPASRPPARGRQLARSQAPPPAPPLPAPPPLRPNPRIVAQPGAP